MTKENRNRGFGAGARAPVEAGSGKVVRDAALKVVTDNMARLKALRLAQEAAAPPPAAKKTRTGAVKKSTEKTQALADWLKGQQGGGRRI